MASKWPTAKIYDRCAYLNCYNGKYTTGHKLFRFPEYSDPRHHLWIRYTSNARLLTWSRATIRRAGICAEHFDQESFVDETRQALHRNVNPKPYSVTNVRAKPRSTSPALLESTSQDQKMSQKVTDSEDVRTKIKAQNLQPDDSTSALEKPTPIIKTVTGAVQALRTINRIKIVDRASNSNRTIILEKCKNPEACSPNSLDQQEPGKSRPHFHKVYVNKAKKMQLSNSRPCTQPLKLGTIDYANSVPKQPKADENLTKSSEVTAAKAKIRIDEATKAEAKPNYAIKISSVDQPKVVTQVEETTKILQPSDSTKQKNALSNLQAVQGARAETVLAKDRKDADKKAPTTAKVPVDFKKIKLERLWDRCAYGNCKNGRFTTDSRLFSFPKTTDRRLITWIANAGNPKILHWSWKTIRCSGICGDHFTDDSFVNASRQRLLRTAVPKPFYLEKNVPSGSKQNERLSSEDLLKIFHVIQNGYANDAKKPAESARTELPTATSEKRVDPNIASPIEGPEITETVTDAEARDSTDVNVEEGSLETFTEFSSKAKPIERTEDDEAEKTLDAISGSEEKLMKEEDEDSLDIDDLANGHDLDEEFKGVGTISELMTLQQEKSRLCKIVKAFSKKLKDAKIYKNKLRSRLLAYNNRKIR